MSNPVKTIAFNTGRMYDTNGQQIIIATLHDDNKVTFMDHSRHIDGEYSLPLHGRFTAQTVLNHYDSMMYQSTKLSCRNGMASDDLNGSHHLTAEVMADMKQRMNVVVLLDAPTEPTPPAVSHPAAADLAGMTLDQLSCAYEQFCAAYGYDAEGTPDDLFIEIGFSQKGTDEQKAWVNAFIEASGDAFAKYEADLTPLPKRLEDHQLMGLTIEQLEGQWSAMCVEYGWTEPTSVQERLERIKRLGMAPGYATSWMMKFIEAWDAATALNLAAFMETCGADDDDEDEPEKWLVVASSGPQSTILFDSTSQRECVAFAEGYTRSGNFGGWALIAVTDGIGNAVLELDAPEDEDAAQRHQREQDELTEADESVFEGEDA